MALVKGPLLSIAASGQISRTMTFRAKRKLKTVSKFTMPSQPSSPPQLEQNQSFGDALSFWQRTIAIRSEQDPYRVKARQLGLNLPAYQYFMHQFGGILADNLMPVAWFHFARSPAEDYQVRIRYAHLFDGSDVTDKPYVQMYRGPSIHGPWVRERRRLRSGGTVRWRFPNTEPLPFYVWTTTDDHVINSGIYKFTVINGD